jgi:D-amino peptidase
MEGLGGSDVVFFVAYHARAGEPGVLAHTLCGDFVSVELNGEPASEARINATLAGVSGIPVGLVTGDDVICAEVEKFLVGVKTAVVKYAIDNFSARSLTPPAAAGRIREAARQALTDVSSLKAYDVAPPFVCRVEFREPAQAGVVSTLAGVDRDGATSVTFSSGDYLDVYGALEALGTIAGTVR